MSFMRTPITGASHCGSHNGVVSCKVRLMDLCLLDEDDKLKASSEAHFSYSSYINNRLLDFHLFRTTCAIVLWTLHSLSLEESPVLDRPTVVSLAIFVQTGFVFTTAHPRVVSTSEELEFYSLLQLLSLPKVVHQNLRFLHHVLD